VRADNEARVRPRRNNLHVHVRAEEAGVPDEEQHRGRLRRHMRLQGTLLREGQSRLVSHVRKRETRSRFPFPSSARCEQDFLSDPHSFDDVNYGSLREKCFDEPQPDISWIFY